MVTVHPCCVSREARTLIFNGTRGFLFKRPNYYMELISLYVETQNVQVNNARKSILNSRHFVNAIECILLRILH